MSGTVLRTFQILTHLIFVAFNSVGIIVPVVQMRKPRHWEDNLIFLKSDSVAPEPVLFKHHATVSQSDKTNYEIGLRISELIFTLKHAFMQLIS